jgi:hypothetical protein
MPSILNMRQWGGLRAIGKAAKVWRDFFSDVLYLYGGHTNPYTIVPKKNRGVVARFDAIVCLDNVPNSLGDEVVEGVDVLLNEASNLEEGRKERELVDGLGDGRGERPVRRRRQRRVGVLGGGRLLLLSAFHVVVDCSGDGRDGGGLDGVEVGVGGRRWRWRLPAAPPGTGSRRGWRARARS